MPPLSLCEVRPSVVIRTLHRPYSLPVHLQGPTDSLAGSSIRLRAQLIRRAAARSRLCRVDSSSRSRPTSTLTARTADTASIHSSKAYKKLQAP